MGGKLVAGPEGIAATKGSVQVPSDRISGATGAGDAFAAGYILGLHEGEEISNCLRYAVAVAAMSLTAFFSALSLREVQEDSS